MLQNTSISHHNYGFIWYQHMIICQIFEMSLSPFYLHTQERKKRIRNHRLDKISDSDVWCCVNGVSDAVSPADTFDFLIALLVCWTLNKLFGDIWRKIKSCIDYIYRCNTCMSLSWREKYTSIVNCFVWYFFPSFSHSKVICSSLNYKNKLKFQKHAEIWWNV